MNLNLFPFCSSCWDSYPGSCAQRTAESDGSPLFSFCSLELKGRPQLAFFVAWSTYPLGMKDLTENEI
jgi:hypothetical protein